MASNWVIGWTAGAGVVAIAAGLLLEITARAERISAQAREITVGLERSRDNTAPLFALRDTASTLAEVTDGLRAARGTGS